MAFERIAQPDEYIPGEDTTQYLPSYVRDSLDKQLARYVGAPVDPRIHEALPVRALQDVMKLLADAAVDSALSAQIMAERIMQNAVLPESVALSAVIPRRAPTTKPTGSTKAPPATDITPPPSTPARPGLGNADGLEALSDTPAEEPVSPPSPEPVQPPPPVVSPPPSTSPSTSVASADSSLPTSSETATPLGDAPDVPSAPKPPRPPSATGTNRSAAPATGSATKPPSPGRTGNTPAALADEDPIAALKKGVSYLSNTVDSSGVNKEKLASDVLDTATSFLTSKQQDRRQQSQGNTALGKGKSFQPQKFLQDNGIEDLKAKNLTGDFDLASAESFGKAVGNELYERIQSGSFTAFYFALIIAVTKDAWDIVETFIDAGIVAAALSIFVDAVLFVILFRQYGWIRRIMITKILKRFVLVALAELIPIIGFVPFYALLILHIKRVADKDLQKHQKALRKVQDGQKEIARQAKISAQQKQQISAREKRQRRGRSRGRGAAGPGKKKAA